MSRRVDELTRRSPPPAMYALLLDLYPASTVVPADSTWSADLVTVKEYTSMGFVQQFAAHRAPFWHSSPPGGANRGRRERSSCSGASCVREATFETNLLITCLNF